MENRNKRSNWYNTKICKNYRVTFARGVPLRLWKRLEERL